EHPVVYTIYSQTHIHKSHTHREIIFTRSGGVYRYKNGSDPMVQNALIVTVYMSRRKVCLCCMCGKCKKIVFLCLCGKCKDSVLVLVCVWIVQRDSAEYKRLSLCKGLVSSIASKGMDSGMEYNEMRRGGEVHLPPPPLLRGVVKLYGPGDKGLP